MPNEVNMPLWINILLRSLLMFLIVWIITRLIGKKHPSRMNSFDFVNFVVLGIIASMTSLGIIRNFITGFIALGVWGLFPIALDYLAIKSKWFHDLRNGKETVLIKHGKIMEQSLSRIRLTGEELLRELRAKNCFNLSEVEFAVMETTGEINVLPKADYKPVTPHDLGQKVAPRSESHTVILDGNILDEPLADLGLNRNWLNLQLEQLGVSLTNVFIGQVDSFGDLYVDLFDDTVVLPQPKVRELLYANLQKIQADLTTFSLETNTREAKEMYSNYAVRIENMVKQLEPYLLR